MGWLIILGIVAIGVVIRVTITDDFGCGLAGGFFVLCVGIIIVFAASAMVGSIMAAESDNIEYVMTDSKPLVALKDDKEISGRFFLGSGSIGSDAYYYYAAEYERGISIDKVDVSKCYIRYAESEYRIEKYVATFKEEWRNWFGFMPNRGHYIIYIPDGSITTEFVVDME